MRWWGGAALAVTILSSESLASAAEKGTVTFVVRDDRGNDVDAKVTIDSDATPVPLGRHQELEAGIHDVHWSVPGGAGGTQKLTVIEGQQGRIFQIIANTPPPQPVAPPAPPAAVTSPPAFASPSPSGEGRSPVPYVILGGGAALAVASTVFQLVAMNEDSDARHYFWTSTRDDLGPETRASIREAGSSHYDAAQTNETIAITCGILAVTAVSVAITWLLLGNK
jgi:hypothetical protein